MRWGIFGDIHGNLEALEAVLEAMGEVDRYLVLGDVVGYGPNPNECCEVIKGLRNALVIRGNHDMAVVGMLDTSWFNPYAKAAIEWTAKDLKVENYDWLRSLPERVEVEEFEAVHGAPYDPLEYILSTWEAREAFRVMRKDLCFVGHSHVAEFYVQRKGEELCHHYPLTSGGEISLEEGRRYIVNPGGVGQPRDGDPRAAFAIFDTEERKVKVVRVPYDFKVTQLKMQREGLPEVLWLRLALGR